MHRIITIVSQLAKNHHFTKHGILHCTHFLTVPKRKNADLFSKHVLTCLIPREPTMVTVRRKRPLTSLSEVAGSEQTRALSPSVTRPPTHLTLSHLSRGAWRRRHLPKVTSDPLTMAWWVQSIKAQMAAVGGVAGGTRGEEEDCCGSSLFRSLSPLPAAAEVTRGVVEESPTANVPLA